MHHVACYASLQPDHHGQQLWQCHASVFHRCAVLVQLLPYLTRQPIHRQELKLLDDTSVEVAVETCIKERGAVGDSKSIMCEKRQM